MGNPVMGRNLPKSLEGTYEVLLMGGTKELVEKSPS